MLTRTTYWINLKVLQPLHIGNGQTILVPDGTDSTEVATIQRGAGRNPWIPGSTLKGALRDVFRLYDLPHESTIFGLPHTEQARGESASSPRPGKGMLTIFGSEACSRADERTLVEHVRRTAVNGGTGASEANKLFSREMALPGSIFPILMSLEYRSIVVEEREALEQALELALGRLAHPDGFELGAGKSASFGIVRLSEPIKKSRKTLTKDGWLETVCKVPDLRIAAVRNAALLELRCSGPYLSVAGVRRELRGKPGELAPVGAEADDCKDVIIPLRKKVTCTETGKTSELPAVMGSGVKGALRKRAAWICSLKELTSSAPSPKSCQTTSGEQSLSVVERLFGVGGYRGRLKIGVACIGRRGISRHPFVSIDPLSQAPADGALFEAEADHGVEIRIRFEWFRTPDEEEAELLEALLQDVRANGLHLGWGTTNGFGWFGDKTRNQPMPPHTPSGPVGVPVLRPAGLPHPGVKIPYRTIGVEKSRVTLPVPVVREHYTKGSTPELHSKPLTDGVSGWIDVSWCFDTPMLIGNGGSPNSPQLLDGTPIIPGSTLRGFVRSQLSTLIHTRIGQTKKWRVPDPNKHNDSRSTFPLQSDLEEFYRQGSLHRPDPDESFEPDFCEALFGFVYGDGAKGSGNHDRLHLRSRVGFGFASMIGEHDADAGRQTFPMEMLSPDLTSRLYDGIARKRYFVTDDSPEVIRNRISHQSFLAKKRMEDKKAQGRSTDTFSELRFLFPYEGEELVFRQRIRFHNLTKVELGAIAWVLTTGWTPRRRFNLGHAKPFGAGRCRATDFECNIVPTDGSAWPPPSEGEHALFGTTGHGLARAYTAFRDFLIENSLDAASSQSARELAATMEPLVGGKVRERAGLSPNDLGYQTSQGFSEGPRKAHGESDRDFFRKRKQESARLQDEARSYNGSGGGARDGRLAAMLRKIERNGN